MPHISEDEYEFMDKVRDFCNAPGTIHISLKTGEQKSFRVGNMAGEITLIKTEQTMYAWGGCGNNIGIQVDIELSYDQGGKTVKERISLGPRPQIAKKGPFNLVGAADEDGSATISVAL
jgi:hypothetical protein